jgi:hypothetical protein
LGYTKRIGKDKKKGGLKLESIVETPKLELLQNKDKNWEACKPSG